MRVIVVVSCLASLCLSCGAPTPSARCARVGSRAELIGGPRALGEVGDWLLENNKVRFIIQDQGYSRGFGVFGGALLDADLVRIEAGRGDSTGAPGRDNFGEMFPAFFLQALEPGEVDDPNDGAAPLPAIAVESAGGEGKDAVLVVRGTGNDFLALTQSINETLVGDNRDQPNFLFESRYILKPGASYVEIETRVQNLTQNTKHFPNTELQGAAIPTPFGDVMLFGSGNKVFVPLEAGYDIRYRLEAAYAAGDVTLPALPGLVPEFIASSSKDVSYGLMLFAPEAPVQNFAYANRDQLPGATTHSLHVPFIASAFTGVFQVVPPDLAANDHQPGGNDEMKFRRAFIVGSGDVASISNVVYDLLKDKTGELQGRVSEDLVHRGLDGASVLVEDEHGNKVTQMNVGASGHFRANLRPGRYVPVVYKAGFALHKGSAFTITVDRTTFIDMLMPAAAELVVNIVEPGVGRVPGKVTLVGTSPAENAGDAPSDFLFDLSRGEPFRYTDLIADNADDSNTRQYIEEFKYAADGTVHLRARPGTYRVVVGRGFEYTRFEQTVELKSGTTVEVDARIARVLDTAGYIGADFHLHSQFSLDSSASLEDRIASYAGEGVELAVSSDHNFVVDYQPIIAKLHLEKQISSAVGLELTTIDRGHFNGFPLGHQPGALLTPVKGGYEAAGVASRTYGSFQWATRTPTEIFSDFRTLGMRDPNDATKVLPIVVQINHPRDSILGYFDTYAVNADTQEVEGPTGLIAKPNPTTHPEFAKTEFSYDFDAMEIFNGKRFEFIHSYRVPDSAPRLTVAGRQVVVDPVSCCEVAVGDVVRDQRDFACAVPPCACDVAHFEASLADGTCDAAGDVSFPGAVDDWLRQLETGKRIVGTGNSDSHDPDKEEPGYPRTYIAAGTDEPQQLRPADITAAFKAGDALATNGPFLRVSVNDAGQASGMGTTVKAKNGRVLVHVKLDSAPWVHVDTLRAIRGTDVVASVHVDHTGPFETSFDIDIANDTFVVVEATGAQGLFPSVYNNEVPPLQFTDVIGALGASFGLGSNPDALKPALISIATAYAITNPIYVDAQGDGWHATREIPGQQARAASDTMQDHLFARTRPWVATQAEAREQEARAAWLAMPVRKRLALSRLPQWLWPSNDPRDIRRVLIQFTRHAD